jgi:hypothetical protein
MPIPSVAYPLINGHRYSFASIEADFNGRKVLAITEINYKPSLKGTTVYGSTPHPLGRTRGKVENTWSAKMARLEFEVFKSTLGVPGTGMGFGETAFDIVVQYSELLQPVTTDTILGARIEESDLSNTDGTDPSMVNLTGSCLGILLNGALICIPDKVGL